MDIAGYHISNIRTVRIIKHSQRLPLDNPIFPSFTHLSNPNHMITKENDQDDHDGVLSQEKNISVANHKDGKVSNIRGLDKF